MDVGFKHFHWINTRSAWQDMEYHRQKRAEGLAQDQANMDAVNTAMSTALQNRISQSSNNAAQAALDRVKAATKAKLSNTTRQLDDAQKLIDTTQKSIPAPSTTGTASVLSTVA
jgi:hypothetical protein